MINIAVANATGVRLHSAAVGRAAVTNVTEPKPRFAAVGRATHSI